MPRWLWGLVALSAAVVAVVLAIAWPGGSGSEKAHAGEPPIPYAYIDKDIYNGEGPCDVWDHETTEVVGDTHKLAVCVADIPGPVTEFDLNIRYDDQLDRCEEVPCPAEPGTCLDDNPDANAGVTQWRGLGDDWDCDIEGEPECDVDGDTGPKEGLAAMWCEGPADGVPATLGESANPAGFDPGDWVTLAVLTLDVAAAGTDEVTIDYLWVEFADGEWWGECIGDENGQVFQETAGVTGLMDCYGAEDIKKPPPPRRKTPTPTVTATPTEVPPTPTSPPPATSTPPPAPTATPFGGPGGIVIAPPPTGSGPSGGGFPWMLTASLLAGMAGAAAAAGGFLRFAKR